MRKQLHVLENILSHAGEQHRVRFNRDHDDTRQSPNPKNNLNNRAFDILCILIIVRITANRTLKIK